MISEKITFWIVWWCMATCLTYLGIKDEIFYLFLWLLVLDFITWVIKWFSNKSLKSETAFKWLYKKVSLIFLIISSWFLLKILELSPNSFIYILFWILSLVEFYSILWNIYAITTWKHYASEFHALEYLLSFLLRNTEKQIKQNINKIENSEKKKKNKK